MALVNVKRYRVPCVLNTVAYATSIPYWGSSGGVLAVASTHDSGHPEPELVAHGKNYPVLRQNNARNSTTVGREARPPLRALIGSASCSWYGEPEFGWPRAKPLFVAVRMRMCKHASCLHALASS